jgi:hypothetical protein
MIDLRPHAEGTILPVRAQPGARRTAVCGAHNGMLKVSVTTAPEKGKATQAVADVLCEALLLSRAQVELLAGATSRQKQFLVRGLDVAELHQRIATALVRT